MLEGGAWTVEGKGNRWGARDVRCDNLYPTPDCHVDRCRIYREGVWGNNIIGR
jgi:hypothetical protein